MVNKKAEKQAIEARRAVLHTKARAAMVARDAGARTREDADFAAWAVVDLLLDPEHAEVAASWAHGWIGLDVHPESGEVVVVGKKPRAPSVVDRSPHLIGGQA